MEHRPGDPGLRPVFGRVALSALLGRLTSATAVAVVAVSALAAGGALFALGHQRDADIVWAALVALLIVPLCVSVVRTLLRGDLGVDVIALIAMVGALALGEYLAGAVIALMLAGGNALEERAGGLARRELTALVSRSPHRTARVTGETLEDVPVEEDEAVIDESALTGEALPVIYRRGQSVRSGTLSIGAARIRVTHRAADSAYAAVVRLARDAETQRAPFVRMADRYAALFLPLTAVVAAVAWSVSGDPVRALTVFVVATHCPLILAAPIALLSGVSRAARIGVVVKGGGVIERLGNTRTVILDKTGTVTLGVPELARIGCIDGLDETEALRLAASVDLASVHPVATALVREAQERGLALQFPLDVIERPGEGVEGTIAGRRVAVGSGTFLRQAGYSGTEAIDGDVAPGDARALVGVDGRLVAWLELADPPRVGSLELAARLRRNGVVQVAMLTGDRRPARRRRATRRAARDRPHLRRADARGKARRHPGDQANTGTRSGRDGRRWHQRHARARTRRRWNRDGIVRRDGIDRDRRRSHPRRPCRARRRRHQHRTPLALDRETKRPSRHGALARRDDRRLLRLPDPGRRSDLPGRRRRRSDPERPARAPRAEPATSRRTPPRGSRITTLNRWLPRLPTHATHREPVSRPAA